MKQVVVEKFDLQLIMEERSRSMRTSRSLAGMGLAFIAIVTPWTIKQVVTSCTGIKVRSFHPFLAQKEKIEKYRKPAEELQKKTIIHSQRNRICGFFHVVFFSTGFFSTHVLKVPAILDFTVTWLALSNGIWNVLVYTLLSKSFRKSALDLLCGQVSQA
jgi:hypothetical protein